MTTFCWTRTRSVIKILNEITYQPYLPDMNFHLSDKETYTCTTAESERIGHLAHEDDTTVPCNVFTNENTTFQSKGK